MSCFYVLLTDGLFTPDRRRRLPQGRLAWFPHPDPWDIFDTLQAPEHEASDHAAIYADLDL